MTDKNRKGGRLQKSLGLKKTYRINIKLITDDYYNLLAKAQNAGMNLSDFVRNCLDKGYVKERITPEQAKWYRHLCGMATNLNQIARKANTQGYSSVKEEYQSLVEKIDTALTLLEQ